MKILLFEYNPIWESIDENINQIKEELRKFDKDIDLIIFPELTLTGFTMQPSKYADSLNYTSNEFFANLAKEYKTNIIYLSLQNELVILIIKVILNCKVRGGV